MRGKEKGGKEKGEMRKERGERPCGVGSLGEEESERDMKTRSKSTRKDFLL
jgi:hypothetical protein